MDSTAVRRRLTCILAADAVGYSKLTSEDEESTLRVLAAHRAVIDGVITFHNGRIVNTAGDSVLAEFASPVEAVRCAVEVQDALRTRNEALPENRRLHFRVGVNLGDVVVKGTDLLGDGVNIASRLESIADPGGIVISSGVYDQITGKLDLGFHDIGAQNLKNIAHPVRAFRVSGAGGTVRAPAAPRRARSLTPWAGAAIGAMVVAGALIAWKGGWFAPPVAPPVAPPAAPPASAAADQERARLQAELATAEKARIDAEARARAADADALRARAENEAAALKSRAQSEAAALRAKAESDAAAVRSRSELDAQQALAERTASAAAAQAKSDAASVAVPAPAESAPATTPAAPVRASKFDPSIYDGAWTGGLTCDAFEDLSEGKQTIPVTVAGGMFSADWGVSGSPGAGHAEGRPSGDGSLTLRGSAVARSKRLLGKAIGVRFDGNAVGQRFELRGHIGLRNCTLALARAG